MENDMDEDRTTEAPAAAEPAGEAPAARTGPPKVVRCDEGPGRIDADSAQRTFSIVLDLAGSGLETIAIVAASLPAAGDEHPQRNDLRAGGPMIYPVLRRFIGTEGFTGEPAGVVSGDATRFFNARIVYRPASPCESGFAGQGGGPALRSATQARGAEEA